MGFILRLIFRPVGFMLVGLACLALGINMTFGDPAPIPERTGLKGANGILDTATKVTTKRRSGTSVVYQLEIKDAAGVMTKLTLPEREISEQQVKAIVGEPVQALYAGDKDVWELTSADRRIIDYDSTKVKRQQSHATAVADGPYVAGTGLLIALFGGAWKVWRRRPRVG